MIQLNQFKDYIPVKEAWTQTASDGSFANFLGVETDWKFLQRGLPTKGNSENDPCFGPGVPDATWGETYFEWVTIVDSIREAEDRFIMMELGGGFAARVVNVDAALKAWRPMPSLYVVVEAEPTHFAFARQHMESNGIDPADHWMLNVALSDSNAPDLFPLAAGNYGLNVFFGGNRGRIFKEVKASGLMESAFERLLETGRLGLLFGDRVLGEVGEDGYEGHEIGFVSAMTLENLLAPLPYVDLIDMDIQSAEARVVPPAMRLLEKKVRRVHIGTHGQSTHDLLVGTFRDHGWEIIFDFAPGAKFESDLGSFETDDGILAAVNPRPQK